MSSQKSLSVKKVKSGAGFRAYLAFPRPQIELPANVAEFYSAHLPKDKHRRDFYRFRLRVAPKHPAANYGGIVLLSNSRTIFDGFAFRHFRDTLGAWIETNKPDLVRLSLGLTADEPGIIERTYSEATSA